MWHDLAEDDYIHPVVAREYVLKGTERLHPALLDAAAAASSSSSGSQETPTTSSSARWEAHRMTMKGASSACGGGADLGEYVAAYMGEERGADAATQTEDDGRQRRVQAPAAQEELSRAETSPPTASTSPEALAKADGRAVLEGAVSGSGRARASSVLMQLISCGSVSVRDARASPVMPRAHHHHRPPRPPAVEAPSYRRAKLVVEDKEYFSGSIVETATKRSPADGVTSRDDLAVLRRSASYNAER